MKVLVIQQKMIGDVLTTSILFEALKQKFPDSELHYIVNSNTIPVIENNPFIDKVIEISPEIEKSKWRFFKFLRSIRKTPYDAVIDVYGKFSSSLISWIVKSPVKIGYYKKYTRFIFDHPTKRINKPIHNSSLAIENRLRLLEPLGVSFTELSPKIYLTPEETEEAMSFLKDANIDLVKPIFMISVLGSSPEKTYPFDYMAKLLDMIVEEKQAQILFNYIPSQKDEALAIYNQCQENTKGHIFIDVYGKSLRSFLGITSHCDALLGNEGGANNMAKALGLPTFTIFSPYLSKHNWFGEVENNEHVAIHLSDYIDYSPHDKESAKKDPETYYRKLKPEFIEPALKSFLDELN